MNSSNLIVRSSVEQTPIKIEYHNPSIKIEYHNPLDSGRVVSQTFLHPSGQAPTKVRKISCNVGSSFPQIAIKKEESFESDNGMEVC
ncbi:hypothetical protein NQ314_015559 [Rhamnusium bicolor]|uniref:Uncharacterized protein n=1 Tax=Rhamnusium bicolor TaxID=1586634 RepID=A0AAV8WYI6_9CUCU|nr:hypothetical protein NQ314_015559 [Rhamnusium bicolor]